MQKSVFIYKVFLTKLQATTSCFKKKRCFCSCGIFLNKWHIPTIQYKTEVCSIQVNDRYRHHKAETWL